MIVKNDLFDYKNRYIFQNEDGFKFSLDSILLAEFSSFTEDNKKVLDMCSGNCSVPLIMSCYNNSDYIGFEIQKAVYELGIQSIEYNKLNNIRLINDDVNNIGKYCSKNSFDVVTCNPPFFKLNDQKVVNENEAKAIARHEIALKLENAFSISKDYLKDNGVLYIVHRAERLDELIIMANKYNINIKKVQLISTKKREKPSIVLVKCVKNSKMGIAIQSELCIEGLNSYQNTFKEEK